MGERRTPRRLAAILPRASFPSFPSPSQRARPASRYRQRLTSDALQPAPPSNSMNAEAGPSSHPSPAGGSKPPKKRQRTADEVEAKKQKACYPCRRAKVSFLERDRRTLLTLLVSERPAAL